MRFKVGDDADGHRRQRFAFARAQVRQDFQRQVMRAEDRVRFELAQLRDKLVRRQMGQRAPEASQLFDQRWIVGLLKHMRIELRRVLHDLHISIHVDLPIKARREREHIQALQRIARTQPAPRFFESRSRLHVSRPGCHSRY